MDKKSQREWIKSTRNVKHANELRRLYEDQIRVLEATLDLRYFNVREIISNLTTRKSEADKAVLAACADSKPSSSENILKLQIESGIWLGYLYFDENSPEKADKYIRRAVGIAESICNDSDKDFSGNFSGKISNFCYFGGYRENRFSEKFDTKENLYFWISLLADSITYDMLDHDPRLVSCLEKFFGGGRDSFLVTVKGEPPYKYKNFSIENIKNLDNYRKIGEKLTGRCGQQEAGIWFERYRNQEEFYFVLYKILSGESLYCANSTVVVNFAYFEKEMKKYADVEKTYHTALEDTKKYYKNVLKMSGDMVDEAATFAVQWHILKDLDQNRFEKCADSE